MAGNARSYLAESIPRTWGVTLRYSMVRNIRKSYREIFRNLTISSGKKTQANLKISTFHQTGFMREYTFFFKQMFIGDEIMKS